MKKKTKRVLAALGPFLFCGEMTATAQTAVYDTSLLRNGNTWVYSRDWEDLLTGNIYEGYSGTTRFAIDSVARLGDTLRFRVIHRDSLRSKLPRGNPDSMNYSYTYAVDTVLYTLTPQGIQPGVPFFMENQIFSDTDRRVVYKGDTVRYRETSSGAVGICIWSGSRNVETVGRTYQNNGHGFCGVTSASNTWTLVEFKGATYAHGDLMPVSLAARAPAKGMRAGPAKLLVREGALSYERGGEVFDLKGKRFPGGSLSDPRR